MRNNYFIRLILSFFFCVLLLSTGMAQRIQGHVTDATTGADLPGVSVLVQGNDYGCHYRRKRSLHAVA